MNGWHDLSYFFFFSGHCWFKQFQILHINHLGRQIQSKSILISLLNDIKRSISKILQLLGLTLQPFFAEIQPYLVSHFELVINFLLIMSQHILSLASFELLLNLHVNMPNLLNVLLSLFFFLQNCLIMVIFQPENTVKWRWWKVPKTCLKWRLIGRSMDFPIV